MKIAEGPSPMDLLSAVLVEGAEEVGTPMRAACLFSDRGVAVIDVDEELKPFVIHELPGEKRRFVLPVLVSMAGPRGMTVGKIIPEAPAQLTRMN